MVYEPMNELSTVVFAVICTVMLFVWLMIDKSD